MPERKPKVSVCIPAYKQVEYLRKTLSTLLTQDFNDYELIVSDDSPDDSVERLLSEFDFGDKLRYSRNSPALGSPGNWNAAMLLATGEYVKIMHHDDFFTSESSLGKFVKLLDNNPGVSLAFSGTVIDLLAMRTKKIHSCSNKQFSKMISHPDRLYFSNYIGAPSATIVRNGSGILFDTQLKWLVDVDWYMQLIYAGSGVVFTKEPLVCTVHGAEGQITQSVMDDREIQIREHAYLLEKLKDKGIKLKKYSLLFQLLFRKYGIDDLSALRKIVSVSDELLPFYNGVFESKNSAIFFKKIIFWLNKKSLNDHLYTLKTYLK
ncbi:MAG: glycosyltransferase family 2 protein [Bacteroidia bacterium]